MNVLLPCWFVLCTVHCAQFERITTAVHTLGPLSAVSRDPCTGEDDGGKYPASTGEGVASVPSCVVVDVSVGGVSLVPD